MIKISSSILLSVLYVFVAHAQSATPLKLRQTIALPGVKGGFDHFAMDASARVLFAAAKGNHTVEVVNVSTGKVIQSITGLSKPHGLAWVPETRRLYVADGALGQLQVYGGSPLHLIGTLKLSDDADDMVYDKRTGMLYVGHGGSKAGAPARVAVVATRDFALVADLPVAAHPEALALDEQGQRVFANIADRAQVAVINAKTNTVEAIWKLKDASDNVPMAYDAEHRRLFIACRNPAVLLALDANSGKEIGRLPTGKDADDLFYSADLHRIYVIAGAGTVDVYSMGASNRLVALGKVRTESNAKTGLLVPSEHRLYVGVPGEFGRPAQIRVYVTNSAGTE